jgi:hypothetical protein
LDISDGASAAAAVAVPHKASKIAAAPIIHLNNSLPDRILLLSDYVCQYFDLNGFL